MIPCYNEVENVEAISQAVIERFDKELSQYDYEILFIDNASNDGTRDKIEAICLKNKKIKAILMCFDFQDPPELIPEFVKEREKHIIISTVYMTLRC